MTPAERVATNIRRIRQGRGWTLAETGRRLSGLNYRYSLPVLSKIELGHRGLSVDDLVAFAEVFGVAPQDLLRDRIPDPATDTVTTLDDRLRDLLSQHEDRVAELRRVLAQEVMS